MDRSQEQNDGRPRSALEVDIDRYTHFLADTDMSEEDKRAFLETLWAILVQFVDLGFDIHPMAHEANGGPVDNNSHKFASDAPDAVECPRTPQFEETPQ
ncbi:MAG: hypothetical protein AAGH41_02660 [Pseudomonadota bacterium]